MNEENVLIGSGDDLVEHWEEPFAPSIGVIADFMLEAESFGFDIDWGEVLKSESEIRDRIQNSYIAGVDDVVEAMSSEIVTDREQWGGDSPGHSGTTINMFVSKAGKDLVVNRLDALRTALESYWQDTGYAEEARRRTHEIDQQNAAKEAAKEAAAEEQRSEEASRKSRVQLKKIDSFIQQVQEHFRENEDSFLHSDYLLITPTKEIYVIVDNSTYGIDDSWALIAERLEQLNYRVTPIIESYGSDHARIPYFAGPKRATVRGWLQTESLFLGLDREIDEKASSWRQRFIKATEPDS
jgi:hypothetical protein